MERDMRTIHAVLSSVAIIGAVLAGVPAAVADAASPSPAGADVAQSNEAPIAVYNKESQLRPQAAEPDGRFWVYEHPNKGGRGCGFSGGWADYANACGNMDNVASSVYNQAYVDLIEDVMMWEHPFSRGGYMCLERGDYWQDLSLGRERFNTGALADDKISSHYWTSSCSSG
jgi:hypothetical protein